MMSRVFPQLIERKVRVTIDPGVVTWNDLYGLVVAVLIDITHAKSVG